MPKYLCVDVGGTAIKYALMDGTAHIFEKGEVPTPHDSMDSFVDVIAGLYDKYKGEDVEAVCMSAPGRIDSQTGHFYTGGALQYVHDVNMAELLKERIPVPFVVENDAKAAALAELWQGSMKGVKNGVVMTIGTGIGGAVIVDGELYRGTNFAAGEFSAVPTNWDSRYTCSHTWSDINATSPLIKRYAFSADANPYEMDGRKFFEAVLAGDEKAKAELEWFAETMASGIIGLQLILDVDKVAIGGGISRQPVLMEEINKAVDKAFERSPFYFPAIKPEVVACDMTSDANLVGALYHYLHEMKPE